MIIKFSDLLNAIGGRTVSEVSGDLTISGVSTDTRSVNPGDCFFALTGENFDAHDFVSVAAREGAVVIVVHREDVIVPSNVALVKVDDTLEALGRLAFFWRQQHGEIPVTALVGSSGKTTTKEMAGEIVSRFKKSIVTPGNLNNLIGLPHTIFGINRSTEAVVLELGMNVPDENRKLTQMADPDCIVLTNINHAHIGMFESPEAHFEAESEPLRFAPDKTRLVINLDDELSMKAWSKYGKKRETAYFSIEKDADFFAKNIRTLRPYGYKFEVCNRAGESAEVNLKVFGRHNISNAVAAVAIADCFNISIYDAAEQLSLFRPRLNRSEVEEIHGWYLVKDYYNAIPAAVILALDSLKDFQVAGRKFAVLGDMRELGHYEEQFHREVGEKAVQSDVDFIYTIGDSGRIIHDAALSAGAERVSHFSDLKDLAKELKNVLQPGDLLFIKGSRALKLEKLYELLKSSPAVSA